jgi:hypothetical protein
MYIVLSRYYSWKFLCIPLKFELLLNIYLIPKILIIFVIIILPKLQADFCFFICLFLIFVLS